MIKSGRAEILLNCMARAGGYVGAFVVLATTCAAFGMHIATVFSDRNAMTQLLSSMETARKGTSDIRELTAFLIKAPSVTVARAELLRRISSQIDHSGGMLQSSSLESDTQGSKSASLKVRTEFTIGNTELQKLLYEIESASPLLFVDRIVIGAEPNSGGRSLHIEMVISAQWQQV